MKFCLIICIVTITMALSDETQKPFPEQLSGTSNAAIEEDLAVIMERATLIFGSNPKNMEWHKKLRSIWREVIKQMKECSDLEAVFQNLRDSLEKQQGTSYDPNSINPISDRFDVMKREFSNLFGKEYKELISILKSLTVSNIKEDADKLDKRLQEFVTGPAMKLIKTDIPSALKDIHTTLYNIAFDVNSKGELKSEDIPLHVFDECIATIEQFRPALVKLSNEMITALGGEQSESIDDRYTAYINKHINEPHLEGCGGEHNGPDPISKIAEFTKWDEEFVAMKREKSEFNSIPWFDSFVSVSDKMKSMMSSMVRVFKYPTLIIKRFPDLKKNTFAAQHSANIESKWNQVSDILNSFYNRLLSVYGEDAMNLMKKIRNINEAPTSEQTARLNDLFKLFDSLPNSFGDSFGKYEFNLFRIYDSIDKITYTRCAAEIPFYLRYFKKSCEEINQLSTADTQFIDNFENGFRRLVTEWDLIFPSSNALGQ